MGNGELVTPLGYCTTFVDVGATSYVVPFIILPHCVADVILGWDFLSSYDALIDCSNNELHLGNIDVTDLHPSSSPDALRISGDLIIPPRSAMAVSLPVKRRIQQSYAVVEPDVILAQKKNVVVPHCLTTISDGHIELWVTNASMEPQLLVHGTRVATIHDIHNDDVIAALSSESCPITPRSATVPDVSSRITAMINADLAERDHADLHVLLEQYSDLFDFGTRALARTSQVKHRIDTADAPPLKCRPYRTSPAERRVIQDHVAEMLNQGVIEESCSPWSSPVVLVKKKNGSWRFCVDYRRLNKVTRKDVYPLPRIDDLLDTLQGSTYFSSIDLRSGYWQIPVLDADRPKTTFVTSDGLYQFTVMPFGLCNAPATFERMMDTLLRGLKWSICLCYLDDVVVFSTTFSEHLSRLKKVLSCFQTAGLQLNSKKCFFGTREIKVLGHLVNADGVRPDPDKLRAVSDFPPPKDLKTLRSFLGLCTYFRKFIFAFSDITEPLTQLLRDNVSFTWGPPQEEAFTLLKAALTSAPLLGHFVEGAPTELRTDASGYGLGAVLAQLQSENGTKRVIAYASRTLSKCERNYSTTEKECLAVIWAISKFRPYLYGSPFTIVTDHHALCWLSSLKDPSGRLGRWSLKLQGFDFTVVFKSGKRHLDADSLSRCPLHTLTSVEEPVNQQQRDSLAVLDSVDMSAEQHSDLSLVPILNYLSSPTSDVPSSIKRRAALFTVRNSILYRRNYDPHGRQWLLVIPRQLQKSVIQANHDDPTAGHLGFVKTYFRIRANFFWNGMYRSISKYVSACHQCQTKKRPTTRPAGALQPITPPQHPFQRVGIDFLGPFPDSAAHHRWIIVAVDYLTRYAETKAVSNATAAEVADFFLHQILLRHGAPQFIISDRGTPFLSKLLQELLDLAKTTHNVTTAYHPQTNGLTERLNYTLATMMSTYVNDDHSNWDSILPYVTFAYNTACQATTGFSPYHLLYARDPSTPLDTVLPYADNQHLDSYNEDVLYRAEESRQLARLRTFKSQQDQRLRHSEQHREVTFNVGDEVLLWTPVRQIGRSEKLLKKFVGPYVVRRRISPNNYEVSLVSPSPDRRTKSTDIVHVVRMKHYNRSDS